MGSKKGRGLEATLRELIGSNTSIVVATVAKAPEAHPQLGYLVDLEAQPSGKFIQARLLFLGTGPNRGSFDPVDVGDEVLVFYPFFEGLPEPNKAIAVAGLNSAKVQLPAAFDNTNPQRIHPDGYDFKAAQADAVAALVRKDFLDDFATWLTAYDVYITGVAALGASVPIFAPLSALATTFQTSLTAAFGSPTGFTQRVSGTAANYRSTGVKSS